MSDQILLSVPDLCNAQVLQRSVYPVSGNITTQTIDLYTMAGAGTLSEFRATITGAISAGEDRTVTVLLQKAGMIPTTLTDTITFTNASILGASYSGAFVIGSLVAGDIVQAKITAAGVLESPFNGLQINFSVYEAT